MTRRATSAEFGGVKFVLITARKRFAVSVVMHDRIYAQVGSKTIAVADLDFLDDDRGSDLTWCLMAMKDFGMVSDAELTALMAQRQEAIDARHRRSHVRDIKHALDMLGVEAPQEIKSLMLDHDV